jgi:DNA invertase Pin-like site-specific DNA recombinase
MGDEYVDNDLSAYSGKPRPEYLRLLEDLRSGRRDGVIAWHTDRLHRNPTELESYIAVCEAAGADTRTVRSGALDLATPQGRMVARLHGAIARGESEKQSDRLRRKFQQMAEEGEPKTNGPRPFGYERDGLTIREDEAAVVRELADRFLAGESLTGLTRWLNETGVPTPTGAPRWWGSTVRQCLGSARISGQRAYHGQIVAAAKWPAIITPETHARIRRVLDDPARKRLRTPSRYLLTGLIVCGRCDRPMISHPKGGRRGYDCRRDSGLGGCGGTSVIAEPVEELVRDQVLTALDGPELETALLAQTEPADDEHRLAAVIEADRLRMAEISELFADGVMDRDQFSHATRRVSERLQANLDQLTAGTDHRDLARHIGRGKDLRAGWEAMALDQQRAVIRAVVASVRIGPVQHGGRFQPGRVSVHWRV